MAKLAPDQLAAVTQWADAGATLNDIQRRLKEEFGITMTYLDARLLMMDLEVRIKDKPRPVEPTPQPAAVPAAAPTPAAEEEPTFTPGNAFGADAAKVKIGLDPQPLPGAMVSGSVTFSDGITAAWYIDNGGRLGLKGNQPGYQPPAADVPIFQQELDRVLLEAGY